MNKESELTSCPGTWNGIGGDLDGIEEKMNEKKVQEMGDLILKLDEKQVLKRWERLGQQCLSP